MMINMIKKIFGIFICMLLISISIPVLGQFKDASICKGNNNFNSTINNDIWMKKFGSRYYDAGVSALQTSDGGYIILGVTDDFHFPISNWDFWLIKTDRSGNEIWNRTFGGGSDEFPASLEITTDGCYIMMGGTYSYGNLGYSNIWLIKVDSEGNKIWDKTFGDNRFETGYDLDRTNDGGYILIGLTKTPITSRSVRDDVWLIKTDSEGNKIWDKTFKDAGENHYYSVEQTDDDGYIILCDKKTIDSEENIWLIKMDSYGEMQWNKTFDEHEWDNTGSVKQTTDGGYIIVGSTFNVDNMTDIWLIKTDSNGEIIWEKIINETGYNNGRSVQQIKDGGYIVLGTINKKVPQMNALLIKTDSEGNEMWRKRYGGLFHDDANSVQQTSDGGYILTGESSPIFRDTDLWLIKTDEKGNTKKINIKNRTLMDIFSFNFLEQLSLLERLLQILPHSSF
jgi:hypothetical protein